MSNVDEDINPYELLDVPLEATEQEIRTAYRKRSLKVHPDRNPNNPDAARKFHELNQASELLLDPLRRLALDAKMRIKQARKERFKGYDAKRKNLVEELEERERAFKKARVDKQKEEVEQWQATEKIKDEGRRLREEREKELRAREQDSVHAQEEQEQEDAPPALSHLDTTVCLKYSLKSHPQLTTPEAIAAILAPFGEVDTDSIVISLKASKSKKNVSDPNKAPKSGTALVPFKQIGHAFASVCASGRLESGLDGIDINWINKKEPLILGWLKKMGKLGALSSGKPKPDGGVKADLPQMQPTAASSTFSSFPSTFPTSPLPPREPPPIATPGLDYESLTLMRLRQAERERLEREIREQEADE